MMNHYQKLAKVKSVVNSSPRKGRGKVDNRPNAKPLTAQKQKSRSPRLPPPADERKKTLTSPKGTHLPIHSVGLKKHRCFPDPAESVPQESARSASVPLRKTKSGRSTANSKSTDRAKSVQPSVNKPSFGQLTSKNLDTSVKSEPDASKKKVKTDVKNAPKPLRKTKIPPGRSPVEDIKLQLREAASKTCGKGKLRTPRSASSWETIQLQDNVCSDKQICQENNICVEEHEYLHFLLRITEDILRNDMYTNIEMQRVFDSHVEANKKRLDYDKMLEHIESLRKELTIPAGTFKSHPLCVCDSTHSELMKALKNCDDSSNADIPDKGDEADQCPCPPLEGPNKSIVLIKSTEKGGEPAIEVLMSTVQIDVSDESVIETGNEEEMKIKYSDQPRSVTLRDSDQVQPNMNVPFKFTLIPRTATTSPQDTARDACAKQRAEVPLEQIQTTCDTCMRKPKENDAKLLGVSGKTLSNKSSGSSFGNIEELPGFEDLEPPCGGKKISEVIDKLSEKDAKSCQSCSVASKPTRSQIGTDACKSAKTRSTASGPSCNRVSTPTEGATTPILKQDLVYAAHKLEVRDDNISDENLRKVTEIAQGGCSCQMSLRKLALKIQLEENDPHESYVLLEGPICLPRTLLEKKAVPVLLENISSVVFDTTSRESVPMKVRKIDGSHANLLVVEGAHHVSEKEQLSPSISQKFESLRAIKVKDFAQNDYDLLPQRDVNLSIGSAQYHHLLTDASTNYPSEGGLIAETPQKQEKKEIKPTVAPVVAPQLTPVVASRVTPVEAPKATPPVKPAVAPKVAPPVTPAVAPKVVPPVIPAVAPQVTPVVDAEAAPVAAQGQQKRVSIGPQSYQPIPRSDRMSISSQAERASILSNRSRGLSISFNEDDEVLSDELNMQSSQLLRRDSQLVQTSLDTSLESETNIKPSINTTQMSSPASSYRSRLSSGLMQNYLKAGKESAEMLPSVMSEVSDSRPEEVEVKKVTYSGNFGPQDDDIASTSRMLSDTSNLYTEPSNDSTISDELLQQLDQAPSLTMTSSQIKNVKDITEKLKKFRSVTEEEDQEFRDDISFQYKSMQDEIIDMDHEQPTSPKASVAESKDIAEKPQAKCCGMVMKKKKQDGVGRGRFY